MISFLCCFYYLKTQGIRIFKLFLRRKAKREGKKKWNVLNIACFAPVTYRKSTAAELWVIAIDVGDWARSGGARGGRGAGIRFLS